MLHQNWFAKPQFVMFEDYGESQSFYDTETENIYVVFEEYGQTGSTVVQEITKESSEYKPNYEKYLASTEKTYEVTLIMSDTYTVKARSPKEAEQIARNKFGSNEYLIDDVVVTEQNQEKEKAEEKIEKDGSGDCFGGFRGDMDCDTCPDAMRCKTLTKVPGKE